MGPRWARPISREPITTDRQNFTSISRTVADLIAYTNATTQSDSNSGKYFFANATIDGKNPVSDEASAILKRTAERQICLAAVMAAPPAALGADAYGNSRPFQTEPTIAPIIGPDYFNIPADNLVYNRGP